jgi:hypothetical protein
MLQLVIDNLGGSPASDMKLTLDRPVRQNWGEELDIAQFPAFQNTIPSFSPHSPMTFSFGITHLYLNDNNNRKKHPLTFLVKARYRYSGQNFEESFPIDVYSQVHSTARKIDHLEEFAKRFPTQFDSFARMLSHSGAEIATELRGRRASTKPYSRMRTRSGRLNPR